MCTGCPANGSDECRTRMVLLGLLHRAFGSRGKEWEKGGLKRPIWTDALRNDGSDQMKSVLQTAVYLELFSAFEAERRGSVKGDTATHIKSPIAAKRKALNWRAVFSWCCVYL
ncbi:hypothetical protein PR048_028769 [Dryococelus australis]|uniref:Uncharacterized protein n=1 Tax=Dryococelus australis TaxID=614101 RepID=A0ABQ9GF99_9NEOP|nr:hypothetical protein PR048_028769 [Dryococelus australis]